MPGVSAIIKNYDGTFLLHLRDENQALMKNEWCLVGGRIKVNETPEEAVKREILEETGLAVEDLIFFKTIISDSLKEKNGWKDFIFTTTTDTRNQKVILGEGKELRFFSKNEALGLLASIQNKNQYLQLFEDFLKTDNIGE